MSDHPQYLTVTSLARELALDRREVDKKNLEPDATVVDGKKTIKLYRQDRIAQLAALLLQAAEAESKRQAGVQD